MERPPLLQCARDAKDSWVQLVVGFQVISLAADLRRGEPIGSEHFPLNVEVPLLHDRVAEVDVKGRGEHRRHKPELGAILGGLRGVNGKSGDTDANMVR